MGFGGNRRGRTAVNLEALTSLTADDILALSGGITVNEGAEDVDFRVESQTNTHALIVDASSSKVGINKSVPHLPLHVVKTATSGSGAYANTPCMILEDATRPGLQLVGNAGNIGIIQFGDNSSSNSGEIYYDHGSDQFNFRMGGTVWAALTNGRLQLGTPGGTPGSQQLHVTDAAATGPTYAPTPTLILEDDTRPGIQIVGSANNIGLIQFGDNASSNPGEIYYDHSANSFSFRTAGSVAMTLDSGGKLGIGNAAPGSDLEISKVSGQPSLELSGWSATATSAHAGVIKFQKSGTATVNTFTAGDHTTAGEILGRVEAYGVNDADASTLSSYIEFANDAVSDADSSPGKIVFATSDADDAGTPTVRLTIDDDGLATFTGKVSAAGGLVATKTSSPVTSTDGSTGVTSTSDFDDKRAGTITVTLDGATISAGASFTLKVFADQVASTDVVALTTTGSSAGIPMSANVTNVVPGSFFLVGLKNLHGSTAIADTHTFIVNWAII